MRRVASKAARGFSGACLGILVAVGGTAGAMAQQQEPPKNLQVLPKDSTRDAVLAKMREFTGGLGVECEHCHAGRDDRLVFDLDDKPEKEKARFMLRMVEELNSSILSKAPGRSSPPVTVSCVTCHHGLAIPRTLGDELTGVLAKDGVQAAVAHYRELRKDAFSGRWDFGERSLSDIARAQVQAGRRDVALTFLELNQEFHPDSAGVAFQLADLYRQAGQREQAIAQYKRGLARQPNNRRAQQQLDELLKQQ